MLINALRLSLFSYCKEHLTRRLWENNTCAPLLPQVKNNRQDRGFHAGPDSNFLLQLRSRGRFERVTITMSDRGGATPVHYKLLIRRDVSKKGTNLVRPVVAMSTCEEPGPKKPDNSQFKGKKSYSK